MRRGRERRGERERGRIIFHIVSFPGHRACVHGDRLVLLHSTTQGPNILDICGHGRYSLSGARDEGGTGDMASILLVAQGTRVGLVRKFLKKIH